MTLAVRLQKQARDDSSCASDVLALARACTQRIGALPPWQSGSPNETNSCGRRRLWICTICTSKVPVPAPCARILRHVRVSVCKWERRRVQRRAPDMLTKSSSHTCAQILMAVHVHEARRLWHSAAGRLPSAAPPHAPFVANAAAASPPSPPAFPGVGAAARTDVLFCTWCAPGADNIHGQQTHPPQGLGGHSTPAPSRTGGRHQI